MTMLLTPDLCVIGAGAAGLSVAAGAVRMGASVVLVEAGAMGGDCLNTGCVPSKALLAAAAAVQSARQAVAAGMVSGPVAIDFADVMAQVRTAREAIAPHDSEERFSGLGVTVLRGWGRFETDGLLEVSLASGQTVRVRARRFVIATGSRPYLPDVPGLAEVPFLTSDSIFDLAILPGHLVVLGAGPQGVELAQAFRRLGAEVTLVAQGRILPAEDPELAAVIRDRLGIEGVQVLESTRVTQVNGTGGDIRLQSVSGSTQAGQTLTGSHLLVATGREPRLEGIGLAVADVAFGRTGIAVSSGFRTTNRRIYAVGDVVSLGGRPGPRLTHLAGWQAGQVLRSVLFRLPSGTETAIPRVVYGAPELAWVGLTESEARQRYGAAVRSIRVPLTANDRTVIEGKGEGLCKIVLGKRDRVLGGGVVCDHAGEMLGPLTLAVQGRLGVRDLASLVVPYPTRADCIRAAAGQVYAPRLFSPLVRTVVRLLQRVP